MGSVQECLCPKKKQKQNNNGKPNNNQTYPSSKDISITVQPTEKVSERASFKDDYNKKMKEERKKKLELEKIKIIEEQKKLEYEKKKYEEEKKMELEEKKIEESKKKLEESQRKMRQQQIFDQERKEIEKERKKIEDMKKEIEEEKRKEEEKQKIKEEKIKLEEKRMEVNEEKKKAENEAFIEKEKNKNKQNQDFYDLIIYFNSFEQLKKEGWTANFTISGKKKFDKCIKGKNIVVGVVGNKNRGKSYLLGRIMKMKEYENPHGFLVTTSGISCIFPSLNNIDKPFVTLDSAGRDNPLLRSEFFEEQDKNELIRNVARDQKVTEIALNDFIIKESDVIITVLEQLSFSEQEMLKNLINQIRYGNYLSKANKCIKKRLIVIHNLMNISTVEGIKKFIKEVLLKSLTFSLEEQITKHKVNIYIQNLDKHIDKKEMIEIIHIIVGDDSNETIKNEFNEPAFDFIRKNITTKVGNDFNILERFKNFIIENSKNYIEGDIFNENSLKIEKENPKDGHIILPITLSPELKNKTINLKKLFINSKGIHNFSSALEPRYSTNLIELNNKRYIEIEFELSGNINFTEASYITNKEQYIITIKGQINDDIENEIKSKLKQFEFQPIINRFIPYRNGENIIEKNKEYEIIIIEREKLLEKLIECDEKYGIYNLKLEIKMILKKTFFEDSEDDEK